MLLHKVTKSYRCVSSWGINLPPTIQMSIKFCDFDQLYFALYNLWQTKQETINNIFISFQHTTFKLDILRRSF